MNNTKEMSISALMISIGVVLPMTFHMFNMGGNVFLPMHIPVLVAGLILSPFYALAVGVLTPLLSSLLTGMPPMMPMLPIMIFELATYAFVASVVKKNKKLNDIVALLIAMIIGRLVAGVVVYFMTTLFTVKLPPAEIFVKGAIVTGLPGIIIQLVLIPLLMHILRESGSIEGK